MLYQVLKDSHLVASFDNLKRKIPCEFDYDEWNDIDKPLILICTQYLAVDKKNIWQAFILYVQSLRLKIDKSFYIVLREIHQVYFEIDDFDIDYYEKIFGQCEDIDKYNQLKEIFLIFAKCSPFVDDEYEPEILKKAQILNPENEYRSTYVAVHLFRKFFTQFANNNFKVLVCYIKNPNPFQIIRNYNQTSCDKIPVIEKVVQLMIKNADFNDYLLNHTSFGQHQNLELQLCQFLHENIDLTHMILMVYDLLNKTTDGEFQSTLLLNHISLQVLDPFIHPLALAIFDFYEQILEVDDPDDLRDQRRQLPKITFLNMDGYDFEFNWKLLNQYQATCQYISVVDEMIECQNNQSLMFDTITQDQKEFLKAKNTYIIPIRNNNNTKSLNDMHFRHILDTYVYPLINSFEPLVIMFSYSFAYFNQESDIRLSSKLFTEIITNLCLSCNYKVIFLPRLLSSGLLISDHQFEKDILKTDHRNILYYLNNYQQSLQQSFKFAPNHPNNFITRYADSSMKIVKSNSFYEKKRIDNQNVFILNQEKLKYLFEILSGFLESCRGSYIQEVKDKGKRMQDPNLQCQDLLQYKILYTQMLNKLYDLHKTHRQGSLFIFNENQKSIYKLLIQQHQKSQKKEDSQFVSFLAQDLKDYVFVIEHYEDQIYLLQVFLRHLKSPVYMHFRLTQYFVNYKLKQIFFLNLLSFKDIHELGIDTYQICIVNYEKYLHLNHENQIWAEIEIVSETTDPIFFRSLCYDKQSQNLFMVYGKDAKTNKLCDQIDIYNFENNTLKSIYRDGEQFIQFARAFASSVVFHFEPIQMNCTEIWTFGGSFLQLLIIYFQLISGEQEQHICNIVEKIQIDNFQSYKSIRIDKEKLIPHSMRPMYGALMLQISDENEKAILIIGGSQNEMLVNLNSSSDFAYKFQKCNNYYLLTKIEGIDTNPISCFSQNHNIQSVYDSIIIINDGTEILGKSYRKKSPYSKYLDFNDNNNDIQYEQAEPYSPYGILGITSLQIKFGEPYNEHHHNMKIEIKPIKLDVKYRIKHYDKIYQPFAQMHKNMKFYYRELVQFQQHTRLIYQDGNDYVATIESHGKRKHIQLNITEGYQKLNSLCVNYDSNSIYLLNSTIENNLIYYTIYSYPINLLTQEINLQITVNQLNCLTINFVTVFAKVFLHKTNSIERLQKFITCDSEAIYLVAGNLQQKFEFDQLDQILEEKRIVLENEQNDNLKIQMDNTELYTKYGKPNIFMYHNPLIFWTQDQRIVIIEKQFKKCDIRDIYEQSPQNFKIWITKFEYQDKDTLDWKHGTIVLPSILMQDCPIEMYCQDYTLKLKEDIKKRKLHLFLFGNNEDVQPNVKIIDYFFFDNILVLVCSIQVMNFIQAIKLEVKIDNKDNRLPHFIKISDFHQLRSLRTTYIAQLKLLCSKDRQEIFHGSQVYDPVNEFKNIGSEDQLKYILVLKDEEIKIFELQQQ